MVVLLPMIMAYSLIGEKFHEIAGTAMLVLFIVHHVLNRKWFGAITKGKYSPERWFRTGVDVLLLTFMVLQPLSGILMSKHLYTFLPALPVSALARTVHMLLAYWGYVLLSVHAGTHLVAPLKKLAKKSRADYVLLDSGTGTGKTFDHSLIKNIDRPYFLAGGLTAENVCEAIETLCPFAVDASSCLETDGKKDKAKMTEFVNAVRRKER